MIEPSALAIVAALCTTAIPASTNSALAQPAARQVHETSSILDTLGKQLICEMPGDISQDDALRIARGEGLERIVAIREAPYGWTIVGVDDDGDDMRIVISRRGQIIDIHRE